MPCNCDHMEASKREKALSKIACLLDELAGRGIDQAHGDGYHPRVYNKNVDGDQLISELCQKLQSADVTKYSLELQIWWRDHQRQDAEKDRAELAAAKAASKKATAMAKLTPYERKLLGLV